MIVVPPVSVAWKHLVFVGDDRVLKLNARQNLKATIDTAWYAKYKWTIFPFDLDMFANLSLFSTSIKTFLSSVFLRTVPSKKPPWQFRNMTWFITRYVNLSWLMRLQEQCLHVALHCVPTCLTGVNAGKILVPRASGITHFSSCFDTHRIWCEQTFGCRQIGSEWYLTAGLPELCPTASNFKYWYSIVATIVWTFGIPGENCINVSMSCLLYREVRKPCVCRIMCEQYTCEDLQNTFSVSIAVKYQKHLLEEHDVLW